MVPSGGLKALEAFHASLLPRTLENALRTRFYRERWGVYDATEIRALSDLPFAHRQEIVESGPDAQVQTGEILEERFTGGTTGAPFPVVIGRNEQAVLKIFYEEVFASNNPPKLKRAARFQNIHVTFDRFIPVPIRFHTLSYESNGTFEYFLRRVLDVHAEEGVEDICTILCGVQPALRAVTDYVAAKTDPDFENPIEIIYTYGHYLAPTTRKALEQFWGATVVDRYGMSEAIGGATESASGWYYFDPVSIPEVVDPITLKPIAEGVGALVVTTLYPFQQSQPLVRYWTGDLVRVTHGDVVYPGRLAIRPLGRLDQGIVSPATGQYLLTPDQIFDVLEEQPAISRKAAFLDTRQVLNPELVGYPIFRIRPAPGVGGTAAVEIALSDSASRAEACSTIRAMLLATPELKEATAARMIDFVVEPG